MPLIKCPDCNKDVSSDAPSCPNCGKPINESIQKTLTTQRKGGKYEGIGFLLIIVGMIACAYSFAFGVLLLLIGFIIFIIGRFM